MASVTQYIGPVKINIEYSSPAVHSPAGEDRRGKIWGKLVPYGLTNLGFGNNKPDPWRAGANENTVFAISDDVLVEDKLLPAGRYGLFMIAGADEFTIVFSKASTAWGSFFYDPSEDALRVTVKPHKHEYREWLTYEFTTRKPEESTAELQWEDLAIPWKIKVDKINNIYVSHLRGELNNVPGFDYQGYVAAAQFLLHAGTNLDQALAWSDAAINAQFVGQSNFNTLSTKAQVLEKLGRGAEAGPLMQTALHLPATTPAEIHQYGRQLIAEKKMDEAMKVFQLSAERNGDAWPVHVGLARGYSATGDIPKALEHAKKALLQAPDPLNKAGLEDMVKTLSAGEALKQ